METNQNIYIERFSTASTSTSIYVAALFDNPFLWPYHKSHMVRD